jgi:hypothetical protein
MRPSDSRTRTIGAIRCTTRRPSANESSSSASFGSGSATATTIAPSSIASGTIARVVAISSGIIPRARSFGTGRGPSVAAAMPNDSASRMVRVASSSLATSSRLVTRSPP